MSQPVGMGRSSLPLNSANTPNNPKLDRMEWGANALSAPTTPGHRLPMVDRSKVPPQLRQAAEGMEAMFLDYLMKTMRQTIQKNDMDLESPATEIYRGMLDSENSQKAARLGGVGLADQIIAYMSQESYTQGVGPAKPTGSYENQPSKALVHGGAHEGDTEFSK